MDFAAINPLIFFSTMVAASIPVLLAALGELVVEKSGVLNLGVEGMMIIGAVCGFITIYNTGSPLFGVLASIVAGGLLALIFGILTQVLHSNQVATGLALTLFGLGLSALIGQPFAGIKPPTFPKPDFGFLSDLPVLGQLLFKYDYLVYLAFILVVGVSYFLNRTRAGLILRSIGENHDAAHALGYNVVRVRLAAIMFGGGCAGLGGGYLAMIRVPQWTEGMTAGVGWIALALVVFASWRPYRVILGAFLFGGVTLLQLNLQAVGIKINPAYLSMAPYIITIVALVVISGSSNRLSTLAPGSLGRLFYKTM
ncbi:MAG: ABC transporter permease [Paracoccaceae bacterium]|nr:ABC transporter permease [Paracoccaceae bacterium]MDE2674285.1 ABC transporter permease [Paracoccaceae bacterium]MXZ51409.1 ABC transporter permease [Paracoccaceae bacterium]MYF46284.1 ABC transporter permease [Paracoccaceae bacterium]MYI91066.1 ABC transporter permease [Paracoccaceae bacterium]